MARFCTNCGSPMDDVTRFCTNCGATAGAPSQAPSTPPPPPPQAPPPYQAPPNYQQAQYQAPPQQIIGGASFSSSIPNANIIERAKSILLSPATEWIRIRDESATTQSLMMGYAAVLAAIPAVSNFIGGSLIGHDVLGFHWRVPLGVGLVGMVLGYILSLVGVFVLGLIINAFAPTFGSKIGRAHV